MSQQGQGKTRQLGLFCFSQENANSLLKEVIAYLPFMLLSESSLKEKTVIEHVSALYSIRVCNVTGGPEVHPTRPFTLVSPVSVYDTRGLCR